MARGCHYLTVAEKDALLAANPTYSLVSGPHETEAECLAVCADATGTGTGIIPDPDITTDCCGATALPFNVHVTFVTTLCNTTLPAQWNPTEERYECDLSSLSAFCIDTKLYIVCQEGKWYLAGAVNAGPVDAESCDPLQISFTPPGSVCGCGGGFVVITE